MGNGLHVGNMVRVADRAELIIAVNTPIKGRSILNIMIFGDAMAVPIISSSSCLAPTFRLHLPHPPTLPNALPPRLPDCCL